MTSKSQAIKTAALDHSIEPTPTPAGAEMMKAIVQTEYGSTPEEVMLLDEIARPAIGDDEVLVRVRAASVDRGGPPAPDDRPVQAHASHGLRVRRPMAASRGRCVAGTVESIGPDVTELKPGDDVYGTCDASFAEFARASAGRIAPKPANLSFEQAAVPVSGLAAMQAVR